MALTRLALRNPVAVLMICLAIVCLASITVGRLPIDMFPGLNVPALSISTTWLGANPEEIERSVTQPLEQAVSRVSGITRVQSSSTSGSSNIQLWFDWGSNLDSALVQVIAAVQRVQRALPPGVDAPSVGQFDVTTWPIVQMVIQAPDMDPRRAYELAQFTLVPQLSQNPGVAGVSVGGGQLRQINVNCDPQKLQARGLSLQDVQDALTANNQLVPSGLLQNSKVEYQLKIPTLLQNARAIEQVVIVTRQRIEIKVCDVAEVEDGQAPSTSIYRVNGQAGVGLYVYRQPEANLVKVCEDVVAAVSKLAGVPRGVELKVVFDESGYVRSAAMSLVHEGLGGAVLVSLVVLLFLRNFKSVVIICVSIPLSVAAALVMLYFADQSLNVFTLGGLTLALGRLVDDAIVVRENITRHLEEDPPEGGAREAVLAATGEVGMPVLASTLTTIAVFVPVVFLEGISQRLFVPLALTIILAMMASYFVSMTVDPVLSLAWPSKARAGRGFLGLERAFTRMEQVYHGSLRMALHHPLPMLGLIGGCLAHSLWLAPTIPTEFFPDSDEAGVSITLQSQLGETLHSSEVLATKAERIVRQEVAPGDLLAVIMSAGNPSNQGRLYLRLVPKRQRQLSSAEIADKLRLRLAREFPGVRAFVSSGGMVKAILNYGAGAPLNLQLLGYDQEIGAKTADKLAQRISQVPGATDVQVGPQGRVPCFQVDIDRERAALLGSTPIRIANIINTAISGGGGTGAGRFLDPFTGNEFKLVTQLQERYRSRPEDIESLPVGVLFSTQGTFDMPGTGGGGLSEPGTPLSLRDVARVRLGSAPLQIRRKNQVRVIEITANNSQPLGEVSRQIRTAVASLPLPDGFSIYLSGQTEQQEKAFASMSLAAGLALLLVYMIMASQFGSLWEPLVIMTTVPLGLVGVVWMQAATKTPFSVMSFMGVIMMVGIVVSNGILLVEFAKTLRQRGLPLEEAVVTASRTRLRPIIMTAVATIVGMIPMATGLGGGSETNIPLARAVIGGMSLSTVLTLYVVPQLYLALGRRMAGYSSQSS